MPRAPTVRTDETAAEAGLGDLLGGGQHEMVERSVAEHVRGMAHTHGTESFRALRQRVR